MTTFPSTPAVSPPETVLRVLVVDDMPTDAELLVRELRLAGYQVQWRRVDEAAAMTQALQEQAWDLVLSDYAMPNFGGMEALALFKASGVEIPFLLISGNVDEEVAVEAMKAGAHDYLAKDRLARLGPAVRRELREAATRRTQQQVDDQLRILSHAVHQAPVSIVLTDITGKIEYVNPKFTAVSGYTAAEALGQNPRLLKSGLTPPESYAQLWAALTAGHEWRGRFCNRRKTGELFWETVSISPIRDEQGRTIHFLAVKEDITERRQSEEKLREQATLLDTANDAIYVRDLDGTILYWNQGAERLYGWSATEAIGHKITELCSRDPAAEQTVVAALQTQDAWTGERRQITKSGQTVITLCRLTLKRDDHGQPKAVLAINSDITEKKQLETQFLRAQRLDSLGALASGIAHDLNNVLTPIVMGVPLLRDSIHEETALKLLGMMEAGAQRGASIVKQVLTFARGVNSEKVPVQPRHFIRDMVKITAETFPKNIRVSVKVKGELSPILADPTQLHQTLMNLCVNARDAMPEGGALTIEGENVVQTEGSPLRALGLKPGRYVSLRVRDTGVGISPDIQEKIFEPFFTTKPPGRGTGLGLSTVLGIVRNHGGAVQVQSEPGKGACFEVLLPASPDASVEAGRAAAPAVPQARGELILVVDDEDGVREVTRRTLLRQGYKVLVAADGIEAVGLYMQHRAEIKAVISDMMMPGMDGPSLVRLLRRLDPAVRIIGVSGLGESQELQKLAALELPVLLAKPFPLEKLHTVLRELLHPAGEPPPPFSPTPAPPPRN